MPSALRRLSPLRAESAAFLMSLLPFLLVQKLKSLAGKMDALNEFAREPVPAAQVDPARVGPAR